MMAFFPYKYECLNRSLNNITTFLGITLIFGSEKPPSLAVILQTENLNKNNTKY